MESNEVFKNKPRNFKEDLFNSNNDKLRREWLRIFELKFGEGCEVKWKDELSIQKEFGTDVIIKTKKGRRYSVELKTRKYSAVKRIDEESSWIMEVVSHIYDREDKPRKHLRSKEGWIYTTTAEYIFHASVDDNYEKILDCIFYSLSPFKTLSWKSEFNKYDIRWLSTLFSNGNFQLTLNRKIPVKVIKKDAVEFWEWNGKLNEVK